MKDKLLARLLPYNGKTNDRGSRGALMASTKLLRERLERARCDNDGVAACVRCNTMFLVNIMDEFLAATEDMKP